MNGILKRHTPQAVQIAGCVIESEHAAGDGAVPQAGHADDDREEDERDDDRPEQADEAAADG